MAKPRIFVSSTYYDLRHIRASLEIFIKSLGYEPVLSESGHIPYTPDVPLDESCYREVYNSDVYVLIIGGRYGSEASQHKTSDRKGFYDFYESITRKEHQAAIDADIPIYILIERAVNSELQTFRKNRDNDQIAYAHVDSANVFRFIEEILTQPKNNPVQQFDKYSDIESWLKEQWAGYFRELLNQRSNQEQIRSLATQIKTLESQITFLSEVNETLRRYLENIVTKVSPIESNRLIQDESERLTLARKEKIEEYFPGLSRTSFSIIGPATNKYNNISWAAGDQSKAWSPVGGYYWPPLVPQDKSLETIMSIFSTLGYQPCDSGAYESGFEKIALFGLSNGEVKHIAKQTDVGTWTSKLGTLELIEYRDLSSLEGEEYGQVIKIMKRPATT